MQRIFIALALVVLMNSCSGPKIPFPEVVNESSKVELVPIEKIEVVSDCGHIFIIDLKDRERIKGVLKVETGKDSHELVIRLINTSIQPVAVLYEHRKEEKLWIVDIILQIPVDDKTTKEIYLADWLVKEKLAWN